MSRLRSLLPKEDWILVTALAVVAALLAFALIAGQVSAGRTQAFDELVLDALRRSDNRAVPVGPGWLETVALELTSLGSAGVLVTLVLLVVGYLLFERRFGLAVLTVASTAGGWILEAILKTVFARERPTVVPHLQHVTSSSFPSGHSMLSAVVYLTLGALLARSTTKASLRIYFIAAAMLLTFIVGVTRVYLGVHYPTDVMAGWLAGFGWAVLCALVARALQRRRVVDPSEPD
jgi:undecaprenyl-diphosphatase